MDYISEINSYNSLSMSPNFKKGIRASTSYSTTKIISGMDLNDTIKKSEINPFKRVSIDLHSNNDPPLINSNTEKNLTNLQDISTKDEDSTLNIFTKFSHITKKEFSSTFSTLKDLNTKTITKNKTSISDSTTNIINQKENSSINNNDNSSTDAPSHKYFSTSKKK